MQLREGEKILKVFHHHPTPFIFDVLKVVLAALPFYFLLFGFQDALPTKWLIILHLIILFLFVTTVVYLALIYWLDRLILTSQRIIYIDYIYLTKRNEAEAFLRDIQDIQTEENGLLAAFRFFDYGLIRVDTPSSYVTLEFKDAPNPEAIRQYILKLKPQ